MQKTKARRNAINDLDARIESDRATMMSSAAKIDHRAFCEVQTRRAGASEGVKPLRNAN